MVSGVEFVCAITSEALRLNVSSKTLLLFIFQKAGDTGMECVQVFGELIRVKIGKRLGVGEKFV